MPCIHVTLSNLYKRVDFNESAQPICSHLTDQSTKVPYANVSFIHVFVAMLLLPSKNKLHSMLHKL